MGCERNEASALREKRGKNLMLAGESGKWVLAGGVGVVQAEGAASV